MKVRVRFAKRGIMKFIGHLDMVRYFQKAFRRAGIDMQYSQGFSPHQLISFASPLGVGLISEGEYMDIFIGEAMPGDVMLSKINKEMAEGVEVLSLKQLLDETKHSNAMSIVAAADYYIIFPEGVVPNQVLLRFNGFIAQDSIWVMKKSKKSEKQVDIKPMIHQVDVLKDKLYLLLDAGSASNLKPELLMEAFFDYCQIEKESCPLVIQRLDMYAKSNNNEQAGLISLNDFGVKIV